MQRFFRIFFVIICLVIAAACNSPAQTTADSSLKSIVSTLSTSQDRKTGSTGSKDAAQYIKAYFDNAGFEEVGSYKYQMPIITDDGSTISIAAINKEKSSQTAIHALQYNAITPEAITPEGLQGSVIYSGSGEFSEFNGKEVEGAIVLMQMTSGKNWLNAASLGAKAVIFIESDESSRRFFIEKQELSPIQFPCFWMTERAAYEFFGPFTSPNFAIKATLHSARYWQQINAENIYCLIEGTNQKLQEELIIVEAFYDNSTLLPGFAPGADEALSIATLLKLADYLKANPPARPVLLLATSGHAQQLSGFREIIWSLNAKSKELKKIKRALKKRRKKAAGSIDLLQRAAKHELEPEDWKPLQKALERQQKTIVDGMSKVLMQLRMKEKTADTQAQIAELAKRRLILRQIGWRQTFAELSDEQEQAYLDIIPPALEDHKALKKDAEKQLKILKSALSFRRILQDYTIQTVVSLHLSSHGDGFGAFNRGWMYKLKTRINRVGPYSRMERVLRTTANKFQGNLYRDTLRPNLAHAWQNYLPDQPKLGGEVSSIAGFQGITLTTVNDNRSTWGTPYDTVAKIDFDFAAEQSSQIKQLITALGEAPSLEGSGEVRNGFTTITGRAKLLLHGELFADHPAANTIIQAYQGQAMYYTMADAEGVFYIKGAADKKHVLSKVILEGYRFDRDTGVVHWAIDKKITGKSAYRLKIRRRSMKTDLIMFSAKQTTIFNLLEPRSLRYMTKLQLLDGRRESQPQRYWYSRIDTRSSVISSIFLQPGTYLKMTLSDSVLNKKMIMTNGTEDNPVGTGYLVDDWPVLYNTSYKIAKDMWTLISPRIQNLEDRGIFNERISSLREQGIAALNTAKQALADKNYSQFTEQSSKSWALASRVYNDVEKTQKDVLFGVLFYIALFVPFAFCMERLLFCFTHIYKRISAFFLILATLITVIYQVHPAFRLAYSPLVVVLAFFILGLSFLVTIIIVMRFEEEMTLLQRKTQHMRPEEISRWKAFLAAFFLGVSNLRRRRLRTALTCTTLIILTFTIMSFTSVKSMRHQARLQYSTSAPYQGLLIKNMNWHSFPNEALGIFDNAFKEEGIAAPRVWLETKDRTSQTIIPLIGPGGHYEAKGMIGLAPQEPEVTGMDAILSAGRWFREGESKAVILPERMAARLGIALPHNNMLTIWGDTYEVIGIFPADKMTASVDLDGEYLTPVTFPSERSIDITEVEMEAIESGEDIQSFQSRYQHAPTAMTIIVPAKTLLAYGGAVKAIAVKPTTGNKVSELAGKLVDRFGLTIFAGEADGTFMYNASNTISYSGVPNIVIPLLISIFIVLNTMISSVYERKKEIGIYTSIGLAPSHVSFLFIAESMAFAVISVVLGYLLAQTSAKLFAGTALWAGITVNYSSMAGVAAMFLVIAVVLISVIYPSRVAAQIAIPDVNRSWKLPKTQSSELNIVLPFLMKYRENESIGGFIYSYFQGHYDCSHGLFSTGHIEVVSSCPMPEQGTKGDFIYSEDTCERTCLHLTMKVWLAPFDFGIMQWIDVQFCPAAEEKDFLEIKLRIRRESGESNAWQRINKMFLLELRKQLLVWRSLDNKAHEHYAQLLQEHKP